MPKIVGARFGALTPTGFTVVVMSRTSGDVTVSGEGIPDQSPVTMTIIGDDRTGLDDGGEGFIGYYGVLAVSGLQPFTDYTVTVAQGGNTDILYPTTLPSVKAAKFAIAPTTCMAPTTSLPFGSGDTYKGVSSYDFYKTYIDNPNNPKLIANPHVDDVYYADGSFGNNKTISSNAEGKREDSSVFTYNNDRSKYNYALMYGLWFGIFSEFYADSDTGHEKPWSDAAMQPAVQYCLARMAYMPQIGDHELYDNVNWQSDGNAQANGAGEVGNFAGTDLVPNPLHATVGGFDGNGWSVYAELIKPLQGTTLDVGETDNGWYTDFGCLRWLCPDPVTKATRDYNDTDTQQTVYGSAQINNMLQLAEDDPNWFTMVGNPAIAGRGYQSFADVAGNPGYKHENFCLSEYNQLYLTAGNTPRSLMDNPYTNGTMGCLVGVVRGDWHVAPVLHWSAPAAATELAENFYEIGLATVNNSAGVSADWHVDLTDFNALNVELIGAPSDDLSGENKPFIARATVIEIDGTKSTPEVVFKSWELYQVGDNPPMDQNVVTDETETVTDWKGNKWKLMAARRIVRYAGNYGYTLDDENTLQVAGSSSGFEL